MLSNSHIASSRRMVIFTPRISNVSSFLTLRGGGGGTALNVCFAEKRPIFIIHPVQHVGYHVRRAKTLAVVFRQDVKQVLKIFEQILEKLALVLNATQHCLQVAFYINCYSFHKITSFWGQERVLTPVKKKS